MGERLDRAWRVVATGFCFAVFGVAGLALAGVGTPALAIVFRDPGRRVQAARFFVHHFFRFFIALMNFVGVLSYELHGADRLHRSGLLILANHPTLIDVIFIISLIPQSGCVVKAALARNPFTRGPVAAAGYITNDAGVELVEACRARLAQRETLVIFPEGTRTPLEGGLALMRGAANVAIRCRHPVTPVSIRCDPRGLARSQQWYQVPPRRMHFTIRVLDDLQVDPFLEGGTAEPLAVRRLNAHLKSLFEQESGRAAS
jgi:1-acyl-sn-glycerol-3-phosphate acyltransferase